MKIMVMLLWCGVLIFAAFPTNQFHLRDIDYNPSSEEIFSTTVRAKSSDDKPRFHSTTFLPYQEHRVAETPIDVALPDIYKKGEQKRDISQVGLRRSTRHVHRHRHVHEPYDYDNDLYTDSTEIEDDDSSEEDNVPTYGIRRLKKRNQTLPVSENVIDPIKSILYTLYTKAHMDGVTLIKTGVIDYATWYENRPVKVVIHTTYPNFWRSSNQILDGPQKIISAYLANNEKINLVLCNWTKAASVLPLDPENSPTSIKNLGEELADFLIRLHGTGRIRRWSDVHIIGFGLGAHMAGVSGWYIQKYNGGLKLGRITGLDPANAGYDTVDGNMPADSSKLLDRSDADFVDIIHCNEGAYSNAMSGSTMIAGHADFYPNGGKRQPDCEDSRNSLCSHERCLALYASSLNNPDFKACQCPSWDTFINWQCDCAIQPVVLMGDSCVNTARGLFFLRI